MHTLTVDGAKMPALGFGTFKLTGVTCRLAVRAALDVGYRHIDTARMYDNEGDVGAAIRESGVAREEIFLTTKVWFEDLSPEGIEEQLTRSLRDLDTDYVDLALVHWPNDEFPLDATLNALNEHKEEGRTRAIGVSNFTTKLVDEALEHAPIACNQVEYHPLLDQSALLEQARANGFALTAYSPLAQGKVLDEKPVCEIAQRHEREPAQVVVRWLIQQDGVAAIPRSSEPDHIRANFEVRDFELTPDEMDALSRLARGERQIDPSWAPQWDS